MAGSRSPRLWGGSILVAGLVVAALVLWNREPDYSKRHLESTADLVRELESLRVRLRIPGMSAAIADANGVVWSRGFGDADIERSIRAQPDTIYHLASLTKPFAATVTLQLVDEGRLNLDAPVSDFGIVIPRTTPVRVWHLMSHTSDEPPGSTYRYDGDTFGKLDTVIEHVTGRSFGAEVADRIIRPLALAHTAPNPRDPVRTSSLWIRMPPASAEQLQRGRRMFDDAHIDRATIEPTLATGYARAWGQWFWPSGLFGPLRPMGHGTSLFTGGGLVSSAPDVARFSMALDDGRLVTPATLQRAWTAIVTPEGRTLPYGLGWFVQRHEGRTLVWHYGHSFETSTLIVKIPERRMTFVVLANADGLSRWRSLGKGNVLTSSAAAVFLAWYSNQLRLTASR
jgi:CubicO group peptidase (beta-lactamase class C family)